MAKMKIKSIVQHFLADLDENKFYRVKSLLQMPTNIHSITTRMKKIIRDPLSVLVRSLINPLYCKLYSEMSAVVEENVEMGVIRI